MAVQRIADGDDPQARNPFEVGDVPSGHAQAVRNGGSADPEIVRADEIDRGP